MFLVIARRGKRSAYGDSKERQAQCAKMDGENGQTDSVRRGAYKEREEPKDSQSTFCIWKSDGLIFGLIFGRDLLYSKISA